MKKKNYVPLHNHSHYSTLDGYATIDEYIKAALENDMIGIGLADHGTASGLYKFITRAQAAGLIPVPGVEFYVAPENKDGAKAKRPIYYGKGGRKAPKYDLSSGAYTHLTVFAYNNVGLRNLFKLTSLSWERQHFYVKPRIDTNMLAQHSEGLIVTTGCPSSEINKRFLLGQDDKAYEYANRLKSIFGDNFYVELMDHKMEDEELERIITPKLIELSKRLDIQPIMTNDSHYAFKDDHRPHERILAVATQSTMKEPRMSDGGTRFAFSTPEYYIKTYDEMKSLLPEDIAEIALENTIKLTEKCKDIKLSYDPRLRPEIETPEGHTPVSYLKELIVKGFNKKRAHQSEEIIKESIKRIREEFEVIHSNDFVSYFLVVHDYIDFAHKKGIGVGAGRGSVGGSEIAYVLDISNTDPIRFDLLFERFLSPGRGSLYQIDYVTGESEEVAVSDKKRIYSDAGDKVVYVHELDPGDMVNYGDEKKVIESVVVKQPGSAPDIDTDFHTEGREEVVQYCIDKYGEENVANIITFGTFKARSGFKAMCTAYEVPFGAANNASKLIPGGQGAEVSLQEIMDPASPRYNEGQDFRNATEDPVFEEVIEMASQLDGRISETGVHPCFVKGTLVKTDVGYKPIEEVKVGDNVLTHKNSYNQVVEVMENDSSDLYELFTANSLPIQVTGNHPMYVREVVKKKSTQKGESERYLLEPKWKDVSELSIENDLIGIPINNVSLIPDLPYDLPFKNKDFWWVMGRYLGDGWYEEFESKRNRKRKDGTPYVYTSITKKICISVGKEDPTRQELIDKINSLFNVRIETEGKTADKIFISPKGYPDLFKFLKLFGKYAHGKKIPEEILNLPVDLLKEFLDGYISADGTKYDNNTFGFSTVSKELLLGMSSIVNKVHNKHCIISVEKRDGTTMVIEGREVNARDRYSARFTTDKRLKERSFYKDGFLWVHISKLNKLDVNTTKVYNLSVIDDNSYTVNNLIAHNCGVIISNEPLAGTIPTQVRQEDGKIITQWEYPELEALGLIKMDLLGLELINTVQQTLENIRLTNESAKSKEEIREIPDMKKIIQGEMDDPEVYKMLQEGNTVGIFQLGSPGVRQLLRHSKPQNFMEIANITALYRPGPMKSGAHIQYADRKAGREEITYIHKDFVGTEVEEILKETFGLLIFQEQIMRIAGRYAGMTPYETDRLRSAVGKKKMGIMMAMKPKFVEGCLKRGASQEAVDTLWETIEVFGQYGFNKSHSVSYSLNIYEAIYLKAHYPSEFMAALIQQGIGNPNKVKSYIQEANRMRLRIGPVDINTSQVKVASTGVNKDNKYDIVYGFSGVKQMNDITAEAIVKERNENGPYTSIADLVKRLAKTNPITAAPLANLALAGAFDSFGVSRKLAAQKAGMIIRAASNQASKGTSLFEMMGSSGNDVAEAIELTGEEFSYNEKLKKEADSIGMFVSGHPTSKLGHIAKMYNPTTFEKVLSSNSGRKTFNVLGTITQMAAKTNRAGNRSVAILMDDGHEAVASYMPRKLVDAIEKGEEIKRFRNAKKKGTSIKKDRRYERAIRLMNDESIIPIEPFEINDPYLFKVTVRGWGENAKFSVLDITKLETAPDGSLPYEINAPSVKMKELIQDTIKQFEDKNGSYVKVNFKNGTSSFLKTRVKLSLDFIMAMEKLVGKTNIVTEGI